jgi:trimeric autotransporter adhesin
MTTSKLRGGLLAAANALALIAASAALMPDRVAAAECLLDTNDNGVPDGGDTDGGALSSGAGSLACGEGAQAENTGAVAIGTDAQATGTQSSALGQGAEASGGQSTAIGLLAKATGASATAVGVSAEATGVQSTGLGSLAQAQGDSSTALGAETKAIGDGSVAIGQDSGGNGAQANLENQFVLGTANHTYTAPGITSDLSRERQVGPLEVVTTDANGNLASDGGAFQRQIDALGQRDDELAEGIAIALALDQPTFHDGQTFAFRVGYGNFEGSAAFGMTAAGIIDKGSLGDRSTITLDAGLGVGTSDGAVAGKAGMTFGW